MTAITRKQNLLILTLTLTLTFVLGTSPAMAGRNANGAMVLHTDDAVSYSLGRDYCADPTPTQCVELVTQINKSPDVEAIIWVLATWCPDASPGVRAFQLGIYGDVPQDHFMGYAPCGPPGFLEIPDATWPGSGTGTAVAYTTAVYPHEPMKMYWFATTGQAGWSLGTGPYPHGDMQAEFADDSDPPIIDVCRNFGTVRWGAPGMNDCQDCGPGIGACCFTDGHCEMLMGSECPGEFMGNGVPCDPNPCRQPEACCFAQGRCEMLLPEICSAEGGVPAGPTTCDPNPCHNEACCFPDGHCEDFVYGTDSCAQEGGTRQGVDTYCYQDLCSPAEACCFFDGHCEMLTADACNAAGGNPEGEGTRCESVQCVPTPVQTTTWGRIKTSYR